MTIRPAPLLLALCLLTAPVSADEFAEVREKIREAVLNGPAPSLAVCPAV